MADEPRQRVVLLGASNVARGVSIAVEAARLTCCGPTDYMVALGHGRSYATGTTLLGRWLPGILPCGLWSRLARDRGAPTFALVTDIGNDILYEAPVDQIIAWVGECFDRLEKLGARVVVTGLPVVNIPQLGPRRFEFMRRLLFPMCRLSLAEVVARTIEVDTRVKKMAAAKNFFVVPPRASWYGLDPIHILRSRFVEAWSTMLAPWRDGAIHATRARGSLRRWWYLHTRVPELRRLWFYEQRGKQPCGRLRDGSALWWY